MRPGTCLHQAHPFQRRGKGREGRVQQKQGHNAVRKHAVKQEGREDAPRYFRRGSAAPDASPESRLQIIKCTSGRNNQNIQPDQGIGMKGEAVAGALDHPVYGVGKAWDLYSPAGDAVWTRGFCRPARKNFRDTGCISRFFTRQGRKRPRPTPCIHVFQYRWGGTRHTAAKPNRFYPIRGIFFIEAPSPEAQRYPAIFRGADPHGGPSIPPPEQKNE